MIKLTDLLLESLLLEFSNGDPYEFTTYHKTCEGDSRYKFQIKDIPNIGTLTYKVELEYYRYNKSLGISFSTEESHYSEIQGIPVRILMNLMATISQIVREHIKGCYNKETLPLENLSFLALGSAKDDPSSEDHNKRAKFYIRVLVQQLNIDKSTIKRQGNNYIIPIDLDDFK
jgi:hypothetical protein